MTDFNLELAKQLVSSNEQYPVSLENAWVWLEYHDKATAKRAFLNCGFIEETDFRISAEPTTTGISANPKQNLNMTVDAFKQWGMMSGTEKGKQIRLYFLECEKVAKQAVANAIPPEFVQLLTGMQEQLNVLTQRTQRLDELEQHERDFTEAAQVHPGCAEILVEQLEAEIDQTEMSTKEWLDYLSLDHTHLHTIARRASTFQKCGKTDKVIRKNKKGHTLIEVKYLRQATKLTLGL